MYFSKLSFKPASEIRKAEHSVSVNFGNVCPLYQWLALDLLSLDKELNFAGMVNWVKRKKKKIVYFSNFLGANRHSVAILKEKKGTVHVYKVISVINECNNWVPYQKLWEKVILVFAWYCYRTFPSIFWISRLSKIITTCLFFTCYLSSAVL